MARGVFPDSHPQNMGMPGMHGTVAAVGALQRSDLLIALGTRFDDRVTGKLSTFAPLAKVIHADIDPAEISKNRVADVPIVGDCKEVISQLISLLRRERPLAIDEWVSYLQDLKRRYPTGYDEPEDGSLSPQHVIKRIGEITGPDAYYAAGVGQHQMWASHYLPWELPGRWLNSGGLGTMGYCVPAAMGAKVGVPDKIVWGIDGDGCFQMTNQELATCALEGIPIKIAVINNQSLGMVRQWQTLFYQGRYSNTDLKTNRIPDFGKLAEAMGCVGLRAEESVGRRRGDREGELDQRCARRGGVRRAQGRHGLADGCRRHQQRRDQGCSRHGAELGTGGSVMADRSQHAHSERARPEQARCPGADRWPDLAARLQHRVARGRANRVSRRCRA